MGHEAVGVIIEKGKDVTHLKIGDRVVIPGSPDDGFLNIAPRATPIIIYGLGDDFGHNGGCQGKLRDTHQRYSVEMC